MKTRVSASKQQTKLANIRKNEKTKAFSTIATNFGTAMVAAASARWFYERLDGTVILWLVAGGMTILCGVHILTLLRLED